MSASGSRSFLFAAYKPARAWASPLACVVTACVVTACVATACAAPKNATPVGTEAPREAPPPSSGLSDADWGSVELPSVPAIIVLPERPYWRMRARGTFVELEHGASGSRITLRAWRAPRLVRPGECEAEVRLARPDLPRVTPETELERGRVHYPEGFDAELSVGVEPAEDGARGHATLVAAATRRCLFVAFETRATGAAAAIHVADRLTLAVDGILPRVQIPLVDARAGSGPVE